MHTIKIDQIGNLVKYDYHEDLTTFSLVSIEQPVYINFDGSYLTLTHGKVDLNSIPLTNLIIGGVTPSDEAELQTLLKEIYSPGSVKKETLDITGLTTLSLASVKDADVITLTSSNATEIINKIVGKRSDKKIILEPKSGLTVTFDFSIRRYAASSEDQYSGTDFVANGTNGDWVEI